MARLEAHYERPKGISSIYDILGDEEGLFDFKHTPKEYDRAQEDYVARRKKCEDFEKYESLFQAVQADLANGKRSLIEFKEGNFYTPLSNGLPSTNHKYTVYITVIL